ncbi:Sortase family protein [Friedmanniella luteola]|uniref:Sortase family protein n=1 Tax=Friedmanniella luteola TaxID=546871 RepID=A0A1H1RJX1_9ACTN|nr:class E sortase [Friedmanniella luteola]SDS36041.1 Sortase family protein [Friedmanniella luteola]
MLALLVPVCAVAPWAISWQAPVANPSADPSAVIKQAVAAQGPKKRVPVAPSAAVVAALSKELADPAGQGYDKPVSSKQAAAVRTTPGRYQTVGRIQIPRIGLDVAYGEGVHESVLERGPGHWPGTALPGGAGTAVLSGHRNTHTAPFKELDMLRPGDKIRVSVGKGKPTTFRVLDTTIVPEAKYPAFVLKPAKDPASRNLTVFACHPEGHPIFRIVVRASTTGPVKKSDEGGR